MKSMFSILAVAAALAGSCAALSPDLEPKLAIRQLNDPEYPYEGCFSSPGSMKLNGSDAWQTKKACKGQCAPLGFALEATTNKTDCWCGNSKPPSSDLVSDDKCNLACDGYPGEMCRFARMSI